MKVCREHGKPEGACESTHVDLGLEEVIEHFRRWVEEPRPTNPVFDFSQDLVLAMLDEIQKCRECCRCGAYGESTRLDALLVRD